MKFYNYFAFSIYYIFKKTIKKDDHHTLVLKTSFVLSLFSLYFLYVIKGLFEIWDYNSEIIPNFYLFFVMLIIWLINYLYIRKERFLDNDFVFSYRNVISVLLVLFLLGTVFLIIVSENEKRIYEERGYSKEIIDNGGVEPFDPTKEPTSLEGDIRLWYYNTFQNKDSISK